MILLLFIVVECCREGENNAIAVEKEGFRRVTGLTWHTTCSGGVEIRICGDFIAVSNLQRSFSL